MCFTFVTLALFVLWGGAGFSKNESERRELRICEVVDEEEGGEECVTTHR